VQSNFLGFEEPIETALHPEKRPAAGRPRVIWIVHHQMLPKIGAAEAVPTAGPRGAVAIKAATARTRPAACPNEEGYH